MRRQLAAIVESADEAIFSVDTAGLIMSWNPGAEQLYGRPAADAIGRSAQILAEHGETVPIPCGAVQRRLLVHQTARGPSIDVELTLSPMRDDEDRLCGAAVVARDVSWRNRAARAELEARAGAERASEARRESVSGMNHELRTPLNAIIGFGQLLQRDDLEPEQHEHVSYILDAARHLVALIEQSLETIDQRHTGVGVSSTAVDIAASVLDVVGMVTPLAAARGIRIESDVQATAGRQVRADELRLRQVLLNLVSNAVKYNRPAGRITVRATIDGALVRLDVVDTGEGIPADQLQMLFRPYERLGAAEGPEQGTGLGLALSQRLIDLMGGSLSVHSECGVGSTFTVELPLERRVAGSGWVVRSPASPKQRVAG